MAERATVEPVTASGHTGPMSGRPERSATRVRAVAVRASIVETAPVVDADADTAQDRPWKVIVWNDPVNLMSYVTFVLQKLFGYDLDTATALMLEVHHDGRAVVADGGREEAEMHVFRLHEHGLWATMEHDS